MYPDYCHKSSGALNIAKMIREEFNFSDSVGRELIDFAFFRQKFSRAHVNFPETKEQSKVLAPYKNDDETLNGSELLAAIMERAKEVTGGSLKMSAPDLQEVVENVQHVGQIKPESVRQTVPSNHAPPRISVKHGNQDVSPTRSRQLRLATQVVQNLETVKIFTVMPGVSSPGDPGESALS